MSRLPIPKPVSSLWGFVLQVLAALLLTSAPTQLAWAQSASPACSQLEATPITEAVPPKLLADAEREGNNDPMCLAVVATRQLSESHCTAGQQSANRALSLAPGDPFVSLVNGLVGACRLSEAASRVASGTPNVCPRDELRDTAMKLALGAFESKQLDAEIAVIKAIEGDLALKCRDDEGVLAATVDAIATTMRVPSEGVPILYRNRGIPWNLTGAMLLVNRMMPYAKSGDTGPVSLTIVNAQARAWLFAAQRGFADPFRSDPAQIVSAALLRSDGELSRSAQYTGQSYADIDFLEKSGALRQRLILDESAKYAPLWMAYSVYPSPSRASLEDLTNRLSSYATTPGGALVLLKARLSVSLSREENDACSKVNEIAGMLADFGRTGAQLLQLNVWRGFILEAAKAGGDIADECETSLLFSREFDRIVEALNANLTPWPPNVHINDR
jgi:hypothetical protein